VGDDALEKGTKPSWTYSILKYWKPVGRDELRCPRPADQLLGLFIAMDDSNQETKRGNATSKETSNK
jgi:hypothetical protein